MPMPKYLLFPIAGACLFFSSLSPCAAQTYPRDWWSLEPTWDWGVGNDDIPRPEFPPFPEDMEGVVVLDGLDLSGRDFRNVRCYLLGGIFRNVNFDKANFEGADFSETTFSNCSFRGANLRHAKIRFTDGCDLTDAFLGGGEMEHLTVEQIQSTWNFKNKDFSNTVFNNCDFPDMECDSSFNFANSAGRSTIAEDKFKFDDCEWDRLPLQFFPRQAVDDGSAGWRYKSHRMIGEQAFRTREFKHKSLHGLSIFSIDFHDCDFSGFTLGVFVNCKFQNAHFKDAVKLNVYSDAGTPVKFGFVACEITQEQIEQTRFWKEGNLRGLILENMNLDGWDFSNKNLSDVSLKGSSVRGTNFENATLCRTNLNVARVTDTGLLELSGDLQYNSQTWASTFTVEQLKQTRSWKTREIAGCEFSNVNFDNCDLSDCSFGGTKFVNCSFKKTNFTGANVPFYRRWMVDCTGLTEKQIRSLRDFDEKWLELLPKE